MKKFLKKPWCIIIPVAAVLIAAAIIVGIVIAHANDIEIDDPDAEYNYTVERSGDGITVTVRGSFPEGVLWHAYVANDTVSVEEVKSTPHKAVFNVSGLGFGSDTLELCLEHEKPLTARLYTVSLYLQVDDNKKIDVISAKSKRQNEAIIKTDGDGLHYAVASRGAGLTTVTIIGEENEQFSCLSEDNTFFSVMLQDPDGNVRAFDLAPIAPGTTHLRFASDSRSLALEMDVTVNDALSLTVSDVKETDYDMRAEEESEARAKAEAVVGEIRLPATATHKDYYTTMSVDGVPQAAGVAFRDGEKNYSLILVPSATQSEAEEYFEATDKETVKVAGTEAILAKMRKETYGLFWKNADGQLRLFVANDKADLMAYSEKIYAADAGK